MSDQIQPQKDDKAREYGAFSRTIEQIVADMDEYIADNDDRLKGFVYSTGGLREALEYAIIHNVSAVALIPGQIAAVNA